MIDKKKAKIKGQKKVKKAKLLIPKIRQQKVLNKISEDIRNGKTPSIVQARIDAGYSKSYAESGHMNKTKTWEELMEEFLPDEKLSEVHAEGLKAVQKVNKKTGVDDTGKPVYELVDVVDYNARHRYLDTGYKIKKRYDNTIKIKKGISELSDQELEEIAAGALSNALEGLAGTGEA